MDKAYTTLFSACEEAIKHAQAIMLGLQSAELLAEEYVMQIPHPEDEANEETS